MKNIKFYLLLNTVALLLIAFCLLSSCGLVGSGGNLFGTQGSQVNSNAGNGVAPKLKSRIEANPRLAGKDCEDLPSCKETCKDIYEEKDSLETCYSLKVGRASELEDVFVALFNASKNELEDIDADHLEKYLEIGLDGFLEKLIPKIERITSDTTKYGKLKSILDWIAKEDTMAGVLETEDGDNEILEGLILAHCDIDSNHKCANTNSDADSAVVNLPAQLCQLKLTQLDAPPIVFPSSPNRTCELIDHAYRTCPETATSQEISIYAIGDENFSLSNNLEVTSGTQTFSGYDTDHTDGNNAPATGVVFDYSSQNLFYCSVTINSTSASPSCGNHPLSSAPPIKSCTTLTHKKLAEVDEEEKELFIALAGAGQVFFEKSADEGEESAFALGHDLLNKACNAGSSTSKSQCKASFYCFLQGSISSWTQTEIDKWFDNKSVKDKLGEEVDLKGCTYGTTFTAL